MGRLLGIRLPGEPSRVDNLIGEKEVGVPQETVAEVVAEVRKTQRRFGLGPWGTGCTVVVPAAAVADDRSVGTGLDEFREQLRVVAGTDFGVHSPQPAWPASVTPPGSPSCYRAGSGAAGRRRGDIHLADRRAGPPRSSRTVQSSDGKDRGGGRFTRAAKDCWTCCVGADSAAGGGRCAGQHPCADGDAVDRARRRGGAPAEVGADRLRGREPVLIEKLTAITVRYEWARAPACSAAGCGHGAEAASSSSSRPGRDQPETGRSRSYGWADRSTMSWT